ncbi:MAG: Lrp/AsnC ligand binding domain-containing protein [Candidatus Thorarchaeota archaeon]|nr:MAG: Lrp/AsnC ligand binding domain-containing protein [Candidatus Thorarchaeota archaeon]
MSSVSERPVGRRSVVTVFYILAIGSGVMRAISVTFDVVALNMLIADPLAFGFMSQWTSLLVTILLVGVLSVPRRDSSGNRRALGYSLDPDFGRLRVLPRQPMLYLLASGAFAGLSTFFYYFLASTSDASVVLPYGQLVIVYLLIGDLIAEKDTPTVVEIQSITSVVIGVLLIGATPGGFDLLTLLVVLGPMNISSALYTYYQRVTKRFEVSPGLRVDSINMRLWSLFFLNGFFSFMSILVMEDSSWLLMSEAFLSLLWIMVASSVATFLSLVMYVRALGRGSMAVVNSLAAVSVMLGIPITVVGDLFIPGAFGSVTYDMLLWILKIFGVGLILIGIVALQAADVRSLVFIKVRPQTGDILPDLYNIKGVETAAALAGSQDYLLSIKSRSLSKTRTGILKKVQAIPEVEMIQTLVVLEDYR